MVLIGAPFKVIACRSDRGAPLNAATIMAGRRLSPYRSRASPRLKLPAFTKFAIKAPNGLGFWKAIEEVIQGTRHQRCWVYKTANVLNKVALSVQINMKADLREIYGAPTRAAAEAAIDVFADKYGAKWLGLTDCPQRHHRPLIRSSRAGGRPPFAERNLWNVGATVVAPILP
jgi:hypothetical protein